MALFSYRKKYKELKKKYKQLLRDYNHLYEYYNQLLSGSLSSMRSVIRTNIHHNRENIRNFNYKDTHYNTRKYVCIDGQKVRSKVEREIYNYLLLNGVKVRYEAVYRTPWGSIIRPDFYLPEYRIYIEYFGMDAGEDEKYDEIMKFKKLLYSLSSTPFVILDHHDEEDLYNNLKRKLAPYIDVSDWI